MQSPKKKDATGIIQIKQALYTLPGILVALAFAALYAYSRSRGNSPMLPPVKAASIQQLANQFAQVNRVLTQRKSPTIHLMWTTPPDTFTSLHYKVLDSYFYHDPTTTLVIHATYLNDTHFSSYSNVGYNIRVSPITDASLLALATTPTPDVPEPCPGVKWLEKINEYRRGPYFYSHLTDYLRFCILFKHGGVYSDFDAIQLSKWNHPNDPIAPPVGESFIGADSATGNPARKLGTFTPLSETSACPWCFNGEDKYLAPGVMGSAAGSILVKTALEIGFERTEYDPLVFNAVGPKAVTLAYQELEKKRRLENVQVLKRDVLYPYSYLTSWKVFQAGASKEDGEAGGEALARKGLSLHLYGHKTKGMVPEPGSILDYLVRKQTVVKTNSSILESSEDEREAPQHEIHVPRFLGISKYIQEVPDIRVVADVRQLELHYSTTQEFDENILLSLQISARHGRLRLAAVNSSSSLTGKEWNSVLSFQRLTPAAANKKLSLLMYFASPSTQSHIDCVTVTVKFPTQTITKSIPIYILPNLVTVMIKTTDRISKVFTLVSSIRQHYPNMTIIVADDGHLDPSKSTKPEGPQRGFYYLPLPHDVGLSAGRNRMVSKIRTKYVLTLDDDFTVNQDGQIAHLIHALETAPKINPEKQFDIAAGKIPADEGRFGVDYCGLMTASHPGRTLRLDPGRVTPGIDHEGCVEVDFVPNVFVARTQFLRETLQWDETLKLGEHEDFFWRAKQLGARTLTCPGVTFYHDQVEHWKGVTEYDRKRARVFDFFKVSLRKHGFVRLVSFGRTIMDLVLPKPVEDLEATNILSRSVFLTWKSAAASFKILQSSDTGLSWSPINHGQGENYEHEPHRPSKHPDGFQRKPNSENWITVYGLKPGTSYIFRLHAGNRFNFLEAGVEVYLTTLTAEQELANNLLENPSFDASSIYPYTVSPKNSFKIVPVLHQDDYVASSLLKYTLHGGESRKLGFRSEITTVGYLLPHRSLASVSQFIPGARVRAAAEAAASAPVAKILVSMQSKIDALFDIEEGMSWRVNVKVWFSNLNPSVNQSDLFDWIGAVSNDEGIADTGKEMLPLLEWGEALVEVKQEFDRSNVEWQGRTVCICVADGWMQRVRGVLVSGILETYRGSVTWDDWVVAVQ